MVTEPGHLPVTKARLAYLSLEIRKGLKVRTNEERWPNRNLILQLELDRKSEQYLGSITNAATKYTMQEADELVGKVALIRL